MAHKQQREFFARVSRSFPRHFSGVIAVDCGSLDVNGSLRDLFAENCQYIGIDIRNGPNVLMQSVVHMAPIPQGYAYTVVSAEMLEHDPFWELSLRKMHEMLCTGGLLVISTATHGRDEHGTNRCPDVVEGVQRNWSATVEDHYRNLDENDIRNAFGHSFAEFPFAPYAFEVNEEHHDLYFWGIKR